MKEIFELMNPLQEKRLDQMVKGIVERFKPHKILCFASNLRIDAALCCFSESRLIESCDYELLTVIDSQGFTENEMQDFVSSIYRNGKVTILNLKTDDMRKAIESKNLYVTTILREGAVLYISDGYDLKFPD